MAGVHHRRVAPTARCRRRGAVAPIDDDELHLRFFQVVAEDWLRSDHFADRGVTVLRLTYETYQAEPLRCRGSLVAFLGRELSGSVPEPRLGVVRDAWSEDAARHLRRRLITPDPAWPAR